MPQKIAKKLPRNIPLFVDYAKKQERNKVTKDALDTFLTVAKARWPQFAEDMNKNIPDKKDKPPADPIKSLQKVMNKVSQQVAAVQDDAKALHEVKERIQSATPPEIKQVIKESSSSTSGLPLNRKIMSKVVPAIDHLSGIINYCLSKVQEHSTRKALREAQECVLAVKEEISHNVNSSNAHDEEMNDGADDVDGMEEDMNRDDDGGDDDNDNSGNDGENDEE